MKFWWKLRKESFLYSRKRKESTRTFLSSVVSILIALFVALMVAAALGYNPFSIFGKLFSIGFEDPSYLFYKFGVYALAGFAFFFAWKCGIINIGISGQMLAAGTVIVIVTSSMSKTYPNIPDWVGYGLGQLFTIVIAVAVASCVALIIGLLQNYLRINSVVSAILLNWIIYFISFFILATYFPGSEENFTSSVLIPDQFRLYDVTNGTGAIIPIIVITLIIGVVIFVIFKFTVFGHKIKSVGLSSEASRFAGYNIKNLNLCSFIISGGIAGILAVVCYSSTIPPAIPLSIHFDAVPTEGFEGIMIALVGCNNPFGIMLTSLLFGLFEASTIGLPTDPSFNDVIVGFVMLGSALSVIVLRWRPFMRLNSYKYDIGYFETQTSFDNAIDSLLSKYDSIYNNNKHNVSKIKREYKQKINELRIIYNKKMKANKRIYKDSIEALTKQYDIKKQYVQVKIEQEFETTNNRYNNNQMNTLDFDLKIKEIQAKLWRLKSKLTNRFDIEYVKAKDDLHITNKKDRKKYHFAKKEAKIEFTIAHFLAKENFKEIIEQYSQKYDVDKKAIFEKFNYEKIKNLINKQLSTQELIENKSATISTKYDNWLTKYVNKIKQKYTRDPSKYESLREKAVRQSNEWKTNRINRMIKKQNKVLNDPQSLNSAVNNIRTTIANKMTDEVYIKDLNMLVDNALKQIKERRA